MEKILKYSVLRYSPSALAGERINIGIVFSEEATGYHSFYYAQNLSRIKRFDDELDLSVLKDLLQGIEEEVEGDWFDKGFSIDSFVKFYINDYRFDDPQAIIYLDLEETITSLKKAYFRFDYSKAERPDKKADQRIIVNLISAAGLKPLQNRKITGFYDESITFDIITDDYYVKLFDFDDKDIKRCINTAKSWAWNCNHATDKPIFIIYRFSDKDPLKNEEFSIISKIFKETNATFISIDEADEKIFQKRAS